MKKVLLGLVISVSLTGFAFADVGVLPNTDVQACKEKLNASNGLYVIDVYNEGCPFAKQYKPTFKQLNNWATNTYFPQLKKKYKSMKGIKFFFFDAGPDGGKKDANIIKTEQQCILPNAANTIVGSPTTFFILNEDGNARVDAGQVFGNRSLSSMQAYLKLLFPTTAS